VIPQERFPVESWAVRELGLDLEQLAQSESVFALSNGHIGVRGNLDEGDPHGLPGAQLNSFYETRPLPYAESGYGFPETGQTIINVTDGKIIRLLVADEPFDLRYGVLRHHERILDLRSGLLHRVVEWESPAGQVIRVRTTRLVSLTQRSTMAIRYEVEAVGDPARVVVQSEVVANEELPKRSKDPRVAAAMRSLMDLRDLEHNTRDGLHLASLGGSWLTLVAGFGGLRDYGGQLSFHPQLPPGITRLCFAIRWRSSTLRVDINSEQTTYTLRGGPAVEVRHCGDAFTLGNDVVRRPTCRVEPLTPTPQQPPGREPTSR
jgi:alpha,alpha-trehalose phosphorylase